MQSMRKATILLSFLLVNYFSTVNCVLQDDSPGSPCIECAKQTAEGVKDAAAGVFGATKEAIEIGKDKTKEAIDVGKDLASKAYEKGKEVASNSYEGAKQGVWSLSKQTYDTAFNAWEGLKDYTNDAYDAGLTAFDTAWSKYEEARRNAAGVVSDWTNTAIHNYEEAKERLVITGDQLRNKSNEISSKSLEVLHRSEDEALTAYHAAIDKLNQHFLEQQKDIETDYEAAAKFLQSATERVYSNEAKLKTHKNYESIKKRMSDFVERIRNNFISTFKGATESRSRMSIFYKTTLKIAQQQLDIAKQNADEAQRNLVNFRAQAPHDPNDSQLLQQLEETKQRADGRVDQAQHHLETWKNFEQFYGEGSWDEFKNRYHAVTNSIKKEEL